MSRGLIFLLLLGAIQPHTLFAETAQLPVGLYREAAEQGVPVYKIDARASRADILVYKGGKLARFGHDHVVSTTNIYGFVCLPGNFSGSRADLLVPLDTLEVDREDLRTEYGIDTKLSNSAKMGTRGNMLNKVLESADWPDVSVLATALNTDRQAPVLNISLTLHGIKREFELPVALHVAGEKLHVEGTFMLKQTEYGIKPFSRMAGALRVRDRVEIHFELVANRHHFD